MKYWFAMFRLVTALVGVVAVVATFLDTASRAVINPFNFFGFFTMQSNIIVIVVLLIAAGAVFTGRAQSPRLQLARACATTYIVIVGIVYNALLAGITEGGISLEWANVVLHIVLPVYAALDWLVFADRGPVPWKRIVIVLVFPVIWIVVVLIRGATDGWVPYPFLDPALGYGVVLAYSAGIAGATIVVAAAVWAVSRVRILVQEGQLGAAEAVALDAV